MIHATGMIYGQKQEEMLQMDKMGFPYACYYRTMDNKFHSTVQWHWHKSIEIDYIIEGELILVTSEQTLVLRKGDICFINSGILHSFHTDPQSAGCEFYAHLFHTSFLSGMPNSQIEQKYIHPIVGNSAITILHFPKGSQENTEMSSIYLDIVHLDQTHPFGYEFAIRDRLSKLWCLFFQCTDMLHDIGRVSKSTDSIRIKKMIQYIHEHYEEPLSLEDIAGASAISRQECMRCFRKYIHTSPIAYLTEYRIRIATEQLLHTDLSIITISENSGFASNSYFSKVFRSIMGYTPKEYRQKYNENISTS